MKEALFVIESDGSIHKMRFCGDCDWEDETIANIGECGVDAINELIRLRKIESINKSFADILKTAESVRDDCIRMSEEVFDLIILHLAGKPPGI